MHSVDVSVSKWLCYSYTKNPKIRALKLEACSGIAQREKNIGVAESGYYVLYDTGTSMQNTTTSDHSFKTIQPHPLSTSMIWVYTAKINSVNWIFLASKIAPEFTDATM